MYARFNTKNSKFYLHSVVSLVQSSQSVGIIPLYSIHWFVFLMEASLVFCDVWAEYLYIKCGGKAVPVHSMKAYSGSRSIAPVIINLGTSWKWLVSLMPQLLDCHGKSPHNWSGRFKEEKDLLTFLGIKSYKFFLISLIKAHILWHLYFLKHVIFFISLLLTNLLSLLIEHSLRCYNFKFLYWHVEMILKETLYVN